MRWSASRKRWTWCADSETSLVPVEDAGAGLGSYAGAMKITALLSALALALPAAQAEPAAREGLTINGRALDGPQAALLAQLEQRIGPVPPGDYWYDVQTGAAGRWGGPVAAFLPPGLALAGPLPAEASGGGAGRLTAVFVNGRELHPADVGALRRYGPVWPGRYRWDAQGNVATEAGQFLFNFFAVLRAQGGGTYYRSDVSRGESTMVTRGCAAVSGRLSSSDASSAYSYYVGCD